MFSCNQLDKLTQKEFDLKTEFTVSEEIIANELFTFSTEKEEVKLDETLKNYNSGEDLIEELKVKKVLLKIDESSNISFSFLKQIDLYVKTDKHSRVKVASIHDVAASVDKEIQLEVEKDLDLAAYFKEKFIQMEVEGIAKETIAEAVEIKADLTYWVDFKVLGN